MSVPVALYTLGQTPRPDLIPAMVAVLNTPAVDVFGVLNGMDPSDIRKPLTGNYPLKTRVADGQEIGTDCDFIAPRLQALIDANEDSHVLHVVLSVAPFRTLHSEGALIRPFEHGCRTLAARHIHELCVVVPYREQIFHAHQKWEYAGFSSHIMCVEDRPQDASVEDWLGLCVATHPVEGIVIDFVGYSKALTTRLAKALGLPVLDLGFEAMSFGRSVLEEFEGIEGRLTS